MYRQDDDDDDEAYCSKIVLHPTLANLSVCLASKRIDVVIDAFRDHVMMY